MNPGDPCPTCGRPLVLEWGQAYYTLYRLRPFLACSAGLRCGYVKRFRPANDVPAVGVGKWIAAGLAAAALTLIPQKAKAWSAEGHQIVAHIAARELTPTARMQVKVLLGRDAESAMVEASTWADEIVSQRRETGPWHYVNIPIGSRGYDPRRDCRRDDCVVAQIDRDQRILQDRALLAPVRVEAMRFLIHFVGDIHQPLHASDNHDRGGNAYRVVLGNRDESMHAVWDREIVRSLGRNAESIASRLEADMAVAKHKTWATGNAAIWADESFQIAGREIYLTPNANDLGAYTILPSDYLNRKRGLVEEQLEKAGVRLAMILNAAMR